MGKKGKNTTKMHQLSIQTFVPCGCTLHYVLPITFEATEHDCSLMNRIRRHFEEFSVSRACCFEPHGVPQAHETECRIHLPYLYHGWDDYYRFHFDMEVVKVDDQLVLRGRYGHEENGLFDEILETKVIPNWAEQFGLQKLSTK